MAEPTVALVTGASKGIGRAVSLLLARAGLSVAVGYRSDPEGGEETVAKALAEGGRALAVPIDVTDEASVDAAFRRVERELGPVTVLVNNAGFNRDGLILKYPLPSWEATIDTNLRGAFLCSRRAAGSMLRARWGRIVNIASAAALKGNPGQAAYSAAKAGLVGMTRSLARELGGRGITVNVVCPGFVETKMTGEVTPELKRRYEEMTPVGRFGTPEEVAAVVEFLVRPEASYVNGAIIAVDGGLTA